MFQNNAEKLLESHLKFAHPIAGGSNNDNKPEKFPRPELTQVRQLSRRMVRIFGPLE